jgi:hypothetical protein
VAEVSQCNKAASNERALAGVLGFCLRRQQGSISQFDRRFWQPTPQAATEIKPCKLVLYHQLPMGETPDQMLKRFKEPILWLCAEAKTQVE